MRVARPKKAKNVVISCRIEQDLYVNLLKIANRDNKKTGELFRESLIFFVDSKRKSNADLQ